MPMPMGWCALTGRCQEMTAIIMPLDSIDIGAIFGDGARAVRVSGALPHFSPLSLTTHFIISFEPADAGF